MSHELTIFDRPRPLRFIGITQMFFGIFGLLATLGLIYAWWMGVPELAGVGPLYAIAVFFGIAVPCIVIGNFVDDLRRGAVIAQVLYSITAVILTGLFLIYRGIGYHWRVPLFDMVLDVYVGNLAASILVIQSVFALYLIVNWHKVVPPPGVRVERRREEARRIKARRTMTPLAPHLLAPDGTTRLSDEASQRVLDAHRVTTGEGMAVLCPNCGGPTPITEVAKDNTVQCGFCGVKIGVSSVFSPCENHPEFLAATTCAVCGRHYCRRCLTAQEPPVDERWQGSVVFICKTCFDGRYRPAVTTASLVIPIDQLFKRAGGRFSKVASIYRRFIGMYGHAMSYVLRVIPDLLRSASRSGSDELGAALIVLVIAIIAIPVAVFVLMLLGAIVIIPILFYAGLVGVAIEAARIIRHTDFVSLDDARQRALLKKRNPETRATPAREMLQPWQSGTKKRLSQNIDSSPRSRAG